MILYTVLATYICVDSAQAANNGAADFPDVFPVGGAPVASDDIFLGCPALPAAPQIAGDKRRRGLYVSDLEDTTMAVSKRRQDLAPSCIAACGDGDQSPRILLSDCSSASEEDGMNLGHGLSIMSAGTGVSASSAFGRIASAQVGSLGSKDPDLVDLSRAFERLSAPKTTDPRLLKDAHLDDEELPADLAGHLTDPRLKDAGSDDEAFKLESDVAPLTLAQVSTQLKSLVAGAIAQRGSQKKSIKLDPMSDERKRL